MSNRLPCPFCGGTNTLIATSGIVQAIYCITCESTGPQCESEEDAVREWNTRSTVVSDG